MSLRRLWLVFKTDLAFHIRRPLTWVLVAIAFLSAWLLSTGRLTIQSGDSAVGGTKAWITSEFAIAQLVCFTVFLFYTFFVAVASGMAVIQDDERKVGEILHATPLTPREYLRGKLLALLVVFTGILVFQQVASIVFFQYVPNAKADEIRGPFHLASYVIPALAFGLPQILFVALATFAVGVRYRKPILVAVLPVALLLACAFFFWNWSPTWLAPGWNKLLMALDPAGFRWLSETHLKLDRGTEFYNKASIPFDALYVGSRLGFVALGLVAFLFAERHFVRVLRGAEKPDARSLRPEARAAAASAREAEASAASSVTRPLAALAMRSGVPRFLRGAWVVARVELRELRSTAGLYIFVPIILLQTIGSNAVALGPFGTFLLATPGVLASRMMNTLTTLVSLLLLFYTVESHQRDKNTGLASISDATPVGTASVLFGKSVANAVIGVVLLVASYLGCAIVILVEGKLAPSPVPFALTWGLLLIPTFLLWACFVTATVAITGNRYATYAAGLLALSASTYFQLDNKMTWATNWNLWSAVPWSDMGTFELDRSAIVLNRLAALALSAFFIFLAVRFHARREADPVRIIHRLRPRALAGTALGLAPWALLPAILLSVLGIQVSRGWQSESSKKKQHDYWKQNLATWKDVPEPDIADVRLKLRLDPSKSVFTADGAYRLVNTNDAPLKRFALTGGFLWSDPKWTMNGNEYKPEDRTHLYAFTPPAPLLKGEAVDIGFAYDGSLPKGITKNGGGMMEFILPSGVVLTSFSPTFVPIVGYDETIGIEQEKNRYEPRVYPDDFYVGRTAAAFGSGSAFTARIEISGPADYTYNSVGILESDTVKDGVRTAVWTTDTKVRFFNVIAGRWAVRKGNGVAIYSHPGHPYNLDEMQAALEGARTWYSKWFREFPWKDLKLSEFPALAGYAQGFPTDITFSEGIGFLTRENDTGDAAFTVTAHEAAHQWWGNMLMPGKGPGGDLLSEGMSHFSTILLIEQVKGLGPRIEFCKRIEEGYGDDRQVDSEKPMVKIDGSKPGDTTVTYDKMGWVMWMLLQQMGREEILRGLHDFQARWDEGDDHPVLQDLTEFLKPYAKDQAAYDAFVKQWFHEVVVPEFRVTEAKKTKSGAGWSVTANVENHGAGMVAVAIAALKGKRFDEKGKPKDGYKDARELLTLAKGESKPVTIRCDFEPDSVVVDPDVVVLQLNRKTAKAKL